MWIKTLIEKTKPKYIRYPIIITVLIALLMGVYQNCGSGVSTVTYSEISLEQQGAGEGAEDGSLAGSDPRDISSTVNGTSGGFNTIKLPSIKPRAVVLLLM